MKSAILFFAFSLVLSPISLLRAETLEELAKASGTEWMIGKWATEDGAASISYTWKLDKHAVGFSFKMGERESEGMMVRKPGTEKTIVYASADNTGGVSTGHWIEFNGHPTLVIKATKADGTETKFATEHIKTDADTMTVNLCALDDDGKPDSSRSREVVFKRQK